jgi:hypothetical protein
LQHAALVVSFFTAVCLPWFSPVLLRGCLLAYGDSLRINLPAFAGPATLWNPYLMSGYPAFADPQMTLWYPLRWLLGHSEAWWNAYVLSAFVLAGSFLYGYLYLLTRSRLASLVGGIIYCCSGFLWSHVTHPGITHAAAWIPLILWSLEALRRRVRITWVVVLAVAVANCFLAGHPQLFVYAAGLTAFYVLSQYRSPGTEFRRWSGACLLGWFLGLCLSAVQILPTLELRRYTPRTNWSYEAFVSHCLPPEQLPQLLFPFVYGNANWFWTEAPCPPGIGFEYPQECAGYSGVVPLLLAGVGLACARRSRLAWLWLGWGLFCLLAALGDSGLLCRLLYHVPVFNWFRATGRHLWGFPLAVAVLAALGVQALARQPFCRTWRFLGRASLLGTAGLLLAWGAVAWEFHAGLFPRARGHDVAWHFSSSPWHNPALGLPLLAFGVGLLALWLWLWRPGRLTASVLLGCLAVDVGSFGLIWDWHRHCTTPVGQAQAVPEPLQECQARLEQAGERICSFWPYVRAEMAPTNLTSLWRMRNARIDSPLEFGSYAQLVTPPAVWKGPMADLLAIRYVQEVQPVTGSPAESGRWREKLRTSEGCIRENLHAPLRRVWLADRLLVLSPAEQFRALQNGLLPDGTMFDPYRTALVYEPVPLPIGGNDPSAGAEITHEEPCRIDVHTQATHNAFLVLNDLYYPGWRVYVDGQRQFLCRCDGLLRGVPLPAGGHRVRFEFRSNSFCAGAAISLLTLAGLLGMVARYGLGPKNLRTAAPPR